MKRMTWIKIHLYLSGISLIFMTLMAFSGSLHLFVGNEKESVEVVREISINKDVDKQELEKILKKELESIDSDYSFDYLKGSANSMYTRPTTRDYYSIKVDVDKAVVKKHSPSLIKSFMELHKGHGPRSSRRILGVLGALVIGAVLSGLWLGLSSKAFRKVTTLTILSGGVLFFGLFLL
ncbi:MAG: PepSY domain-containing protein [Bdellovibrionota bacterium]|nr:PepSY domain-containing protein [Bdellovibrionota bacterium]